MNNRKVKKLIKKLRKIERTKGPSSREFRRIFAALSGECGYGHILPVNQNGTKVNRDGGNTRMEVHPEKDET